MKKVYDCPVTWTDSAGIRHGCRSHGIPGKHWCPDGSTHPVVEKICHALHPLRDQFVSITTADGVLVEQFDSDDFDQTPTLLATEIREAIERAERLEGIRPEVFSNAMEAAGYCGVQTAPPPKNGAVVCGSALPCEVHSVDDARPGPETRADVADYVHGAVAASAQDHPEPYAGGWISGGMYPPPEEVERG